MNEELSHCCKAPKEVRKELDEWIKTYSGADWLEALIAKLDSLTEE